MFATAHDNRKDRVAPLNDASRPFIALKPAGYLNRVIGRYSTMKAAKEAANRWNSDN